MQDASDRTEEVDKYAGPIGFLRQVIKKILDEQISGFAQMVAYNVLFATAPLLMVVTAGAATLTRAVNSDLENPAQPILDWVQNNLPADAASFLQQPIEQAVNADTSWFFSIGALFALWGARGAIAAMIRGLNMAYGIDREQRSFVRQTVRAIGLTLMLILLVAVGGLVFTLGSDIGDRVASAIGLGDLWNSVSFFVRWPLVVAISVIAVMTLHRFGPSVKDPFTWYLPGSLFSVIGVYLVTIALGIWLGQSTGFTEAYGVFGSVLAFILWLYLTSFVLLIGGVINAVIHQRYTGEEAVQGS